VVADAPIVLASLRDELFARPTSSPAIQDGEPAVLCGVDRQAGGTWLGVNACGLVVSVTNRRAADGAPAPRSRGTLCRDMLRLADAAEAAQLAARQLATRLYGGANFLCVDRRSMYYVRGGADIQTMQLAPGLHLLGNQDADDPRDLRLQLAATLVPERDRISGGAAELVGSLQAAFTAPPVESSDVELVLRGGDRGTVSSTIIAVGDAPEQMIYRYAAGPPDRHPYDDYSPALRQILARG
jgi:hypothetical protein